MNKDNNYNKEIKKKYRNPFYVSRAWIKIRTAYINEYPLCEVCKKKDKIVLATEIDHKIAIRIDYDLRMEWDNLQALCHRCHSKKTKAVDERVLKGLKPKAWMGCGADGLPIDTNHSWNE